MKIVHKRLEGSRDLNLPTMRQISRRLNLDTEDTNIVLINAMMRDGYSPHDLRSQGVDMATAWADVNVDKLEREARIFRQMDRNEYLDNRFGHVIGQNPAIPVTDG